MQMRQLLVGLVTLGVSSGLYAQQPSVDNRIHQQTHASQHQIDANETSAEPTDGEEDMAIIETSDSVELGAIDTNQLNQFVQLFDTLRQQYVNPVSDATLFDHAMQGMVKQLDPYAEFLDAQAYDTLREFTQGDVADIGIQIAQNTKGKWEVVHVASQSPAAKKGVTEGDYVHQIDRVKLNARMTKAEVNTMLSGLAGSKVKLTLSDGGRRRHEVAIQRTLLQMTQLQAHIRDGIAIIKIPIFTQSTYTQLLQRLMTANQAFYAVIIDIRDNPGGVLSAAQQIGGLFAPNKTLAMVVGRNQKAEPLYAINTGYLQGVPVVVLQNYLSASAAEVLASGLQTTKTAVIWGETSYGKGSIQSIIPIDGNQAVKLTVANYLTANNQRIDNVGVVPERMLDALPSQWVDIAIDYLHQLPEEIQSKRIRLTERLIENDQEDSLSIDAPTDSLD